MWNMIGNITKYKLAINAMENGNKHKQKSAAWEMITNILFTGTNI